MTINEFPKIIFWNKCCNKTKTTLLTRPFAKNSKNVAINVKNILNQVKLNGDSALKALTLKFDKIEIKQFRIKDSKIKTAQNKLSNKIKEAMKIAKNNITMFHQAQKTKTINVTTLPGILCQQTTLPLNSVGLYIPGKSAPLVSTVLMLAIPASIAGCKRIIICSPPPIADEILYAAHLCNIQEIYQIGGIQAVAAMGFGTKSIIKVNKIFGPGNTWVTEAKRQISQMTNGPSIDMLAGPSELIIIADKQANPIYVAADLLSQAEHGQDSQVILLTPNIELAIKVQKEINKQILSLPRTKIIIKSLINSLLIITDNLEECISISNQYGPEHLIIQTKYPRSLIKNITNAGSIFLGDWSPESAGDYASGTNHILPTYGYTITHSGLSLIDFQKRITIQQLSKEGLIKLAPTIQTLAKAEGLIAHERSITLRTTNSKENNEH